MALSEDTDSTRELNIKHVQVDGLTWVNIEKPTEVETDYLSQHYPFHPLDLDDCLSRIQRPKIDQYEDYVFIVLHFPVFNKESRVTLSSQVSIFVGADYLVTLHAGELKPLVKLFRDCELREEARQENLKSSGFLLYRIVDRLVDYCLPILGKIMENIEKVEDDIFGPRKRQTMYTISRLRRDIISFRRTVWPLRAVIASLEHHSEKFTKEDMEVYWGDVVDHLDKIWDTLDECKEIIEGLNDTNNSLYSYRTNEVIRVLTVITTIMLPLTVITGFMGMNIVLPGGIDKGDFLAFSILVTIMIVVSVSMLILFRSRRWI